MSKPTDPPSDPLYDRLPSAYAAALRLRDVGTPDDVIARQLGVDVTSVPGLLVVAAAKLAHLDRDQPPAGLEAEP